MIAFSHLAIGAASGHIVNNYYSSHVFLRRVILSFFVGLISHLVLDSFPHVEYSQGGYSLGLVLLLEIIVALTIIFIPPRFTRANVVIFVSMFGAAFPDLCSLIPQYLVRVEVISRASLLLHKFHARESANFEIGFLSQIFLGFVAIFYIRLKNR